MKILTERPQRVRSFVMSKEKLCYIALVNDTELDGGSSEKNQTYLLSDEHIITVGAERFRFTSAVPAKFHQ